jgi:hypothetical protein
MQIPTGATVSKNMAAQKKLASDQDQTAKRVAENAEGKI